ncbi:hypothetical protein AVEN_132962-1 [Araneus ventricosus]|uniref:Uncharacterized protein n=1 Tax=Araneus ventricosus TaxID=182803 RepID=A0A4Y2WHX1_ARAVE|nr:hypothetical protein AVEN_132962-1 [Araneus ventricosus]
MRPYVPWSPGSHSPSRPHTSSARNSSDSSHTGDNRFFSAWEEGSNESLESVSNDNLERGQEAHDKRLPSFIRSKDVKQRKLPENIRLYAKKIREFRNSPDLDAV